MRRALSHILHFALLAGIILAILWAIVGPDSAGLTQNPLAVGGLALIGLGLCKSERDRRLTAAEAPESSEPR